MVIAIIVAFVVVIHVQGLVSVYLSLVKIKYSVCVWKKKKKDIFKVMKRKNLQPRLLYPARISFRFDGEIKTFTDKQKLREFSTNKPALQQMLKEIL